MKKSLIAVLAGVAFSMFISVASAGPILQFRLAGDTASDDAERMSYVTHNAEHSYTNVLYVQKAVLLDESMLKSATAGKDFLGHDIIDLQFNETGTKKFAEITHGNIDKKLAILINGKVIEAPVIKSEISGGRAQISGVFNKQETQDLVKKLNEAVKGK